MATKIEKKETQKKREKIKLKKYQKVLCVFLFLLFFLILIVSVSKLFLFHRDLKNGENEIRELLEDSIENYEEVMDSENIEDIQIDFESLKMKNEDIVGWIFFNHKLVNNPIVQTSDNEYYLNHSFKKNKNSIGSIFMDYRNHSLEDQNIVLFGHNSTNKTMFGSLGDVFKENYFDEENADIIYLFDTENNLRKYQIFSYYTVEKEEYYITTSFKNKTEYQEFLNTIKKRSIKNLNVEVSSKDKIITLSTCYGSSGTSKRRVIHAKLIN